MYRRLLNSMVFTPLVALIAIPAFADLGSIHISISTSAPPRAQYERRPARPHPEALWINGYWDRQDDQWAWLSGRWERPNYPSARWINARYTREGCPWYHRSGCVWRYEPAHWSNQQLVEGEDYQRWKHENGSGHGKGHGKGHDSGHGKGHN